MGRWTQYDEDEYRLPQGMKRAGYDADTGLFLFQDRNGVMWQGAQGAQFSEMTRVSGPLPAVTEESNEGDLEAAPSRPDGYRPVAVDPSTMAYVHNGSASAYRTLFPFFLIIAVMLLLVWRLILSPGLAAPAPLCPKGSTAYWVQPGDSCWEISRMHGCTLDEFKELNPSIKCESLMPGATVCLPDAPRPPSK